jgi:hypothetical protein
MGATERYGACARKRLQKFNLRCLTAIFAAPLSLVPSSAPAV